MDDKGISLTESFSNRVTFFLEEQPTALHGELTIGRHQLPVLDLDGSTHDTIWHQLAAKDSFQLQCKSPRHLYTLFGCDARGSQVHPKYIVGGTHNSEFVGVEIELSGLSAWLDPITQFEFRVSEIRKDISKDNFSVPFSLDGNKYILSSEYNCTIRNPEKRDFIVSETTTIRVSKVGGLLSVEEGEELAHEVRRLFSLLLGLPLSIRYAWLLKKDSATRLPFYFWYTGDPDEPFENWREAFVRARFIYENNAWPTVVKSYFSTSRSSFNKIWRGLVYFFSYIGAWEYELLGYVSILDAYVSKVSEKNRKKIPKKIYSDAMEEIDQVIEKFRSANRDVDSKLFDSLKAGISEVKNTDLPTFRHKFDRMMSEVDPHIKEIIGFTSIEFTAIKKIRDDAAHGLPVKAKDGRNLSFELTIRDKLRILLMYFVYRDFGFSPADFAGGISGTTSRFVRNARIDSLKRDKLSGMMPCYGMDEEQFKLADEYSYWLALDHSKSEDVYRVNETVSPEIAQWHFSTHPDGAKLSDYVLAKFPHLEAQQVTYTFGALLCCGDKLQKFSTICIIEVE